MDPITKNKIIKQCTNISVAVETLLKHKLSHKETETMLLFIEAATKEILSLTERS